jgi:hypothetical protein
MNVKTMIYVAQVGCEVNQGLCDLVYSAAESAVQERPSLNVTLWTGEVEQSDAPLNITTIPTIIFFEETSNVSLGRLQGNQINYDNIKSMLIQLEGFEQVGEGEFENEDGLTIGNGSELQIGLFGLLNLPGWLGKLALFLLGFIIITNADRD